MNRKAAKATALALACEALSDNGCDCNGDRKCLACLCETALEILWQDARKKENQDLHQQLIDFAADQIRLTGELCEEIDHLRAQLARTTR